MDITAEVFNLLSQLGKLYWNTTPDTGPEEQEFMIAQIMGGEPDGFYLEKGAQEFAHARVQIGAFSTDIVKASKLSRAVHEAFADSPLATEAFTAPISVYDGVRKIYGFNRQFGVWYQPETI